MKDDGQINEVKEATVTPDTANAALQNCHSSIPKIFFNNREVFLNQLTIYLNQTDGNEKKSNILDVNNLSDNLDMLDITILNQNSLHLSSYSKVLSNIDKIQSIYKESMTKINNFKEELKQLEYVTCKIDLLINEKNTKLSNIALTYEKLQSIKDLESNILVLSNSMSTFSTFSSKEPTDVSQKNKLKEIFQIFKGIDNLTDLKISNLDCISHLILEIKEYKSQFKLKIKSLFITSILHQDSITCKNNDELIKLCILIGKEYNWINNIIDEYKDSLLDYIKRNITESIKETDNVFDLLDYIIFILIKYLKKHDYLLSLTTHSSIDSFVDFSGVSVKLNNLIMTSSKQLILSLMNDGNFNLNNKLIINKLYNYLNIILTKYNILEMKSIERLFISCLLQKYQNIYQIYYKVIKHTFQHENFIQVKIHPFYSIFLQQEEREREIGRLRSEEEEEEKEESEDEEDKLISLIIKIEDKMKNDFNNSHLSFSSIESKYLKDTLYHFNKSYKLLNITIIFIFCLKRLQTIHNSVFITQQQQPKHSENKKFELTNGLSNEDEGENTIDEVPGYEKYWMNLVELFVENIENLIIKAGACKSKAKLKSISTKILCLTITSIDFVYQFVIKFSEMTLILNNVKDKVMNKFTHLVLSLFNSCFSLNNTSKSEIKRFCSGLLSLNKIITRHLGSEMKNKVFGKILNIIKEKYITFLELQSNDVSKLKEHDFIFTTRFEINEFISCFNTLELNVDQQVLSNEVVAGFKARLQEFKSQHILTEIVNELIDKVEYEFEVAESAKR